MRVLVMGAGALGSVAGGFLAKAGHDITLAGRAPHMQAIARSGLRITGIWGDHVIRNLHTVCLVAELGPDAFEFVLITVKSYDTRNAVESVLPVVGPETLVCAYQNGLGNAEIIAEAVGWPRTVGARAIYGARMEAPGHVDVTVIASPTALGIYDPAAPEDRVRELARAMDDAGLPTLYTDRIPTLLWAKVAYNCALNPLSALLDRPYGFVAETEHTRAIARDVITELYAVGQAMEIPLNPASPAGFLHEFYEKMLPPTAAHYASMREDLRRGRRTEIDALNGAIARYGAALGIDCPANAMLTRLIHAREAAGRE